MEFISQHIKEIISLSFALLGLILFFFSCYYYIIAQRTLNWQITDGIVLTSDLIKARSDTMSDNSYTIQYKAEICYTYKILNEKFVSNKISYMPNYSTSASRLAYKRVVKYPADSKVQVYYNPANPEEAVLEPGVKNEHIIFLIISALIFLISLSVGLSFIFENKL